MPNKITTIVSPVSYQRQQQQQRLIDNNKKNRILIVDDDNPDNNITLKLDLERNGFIVDTFTDPLVALDNFRAGLFDMVVLDKRMRKMNSVDLHNKFKKIDDKVSLLDCLANITTRQSIVYAYTRKLE